MEIRSNHVAVLFWDIPGPSEANAKSIAEFMGAEVALISLSKVETLDAIQRLISPYAAVIVSANAIIRIADSFATTTQLSALLNSVPSVLIYGFESSDRHAELLAHTSSGGLLTVQSLRSQTSFQASSKDRQFCAQFTGLVVGKVDPKIDKGFIEGTPTEHQDTLIRAGGQPFFVRLGHGESESFLLASGEFGNLSEEVSIDAGLLPWFSRIVPLMIFLRRALGNGLWHSEQSQACFIIDDPLLKSSYGFLKYQELLDTMKQERFSSCIAFIPWNYRRSSEDIAESISVGPQSLSMCVHGCDHTAGEFVGDLETLTSKAQLALKRMKSHAQRYKIPFDDVMVFPQGLFSSDALRALDACGYLSAINTDLQPSDMSRALTLKDLLDIAVTKWSDFPLFWRHYPKDIAEFAFDLFLGKPALIVEHHGYFRNGLAPLTSFVKQLNQLDKNLQWQNPAAICASASLRRVSPDGQIHVRFYTNRFRLINDSSQARSYVLCRKWDESKPLPAITLNGRQCEVQRKDNSLQIELSLAAMETADIQVVAEGAVATIETPLRTSIAQAVKVFARRALCEFRDDYVETNPLLLRLLASARRLRTGRKASSADFSPTFPQSTLPQESRQ